MLTLDVKKTLPWILYLIFFSVLNETVFTVSTPAIAAEFALTPTGVSWMMTTFIVFFGVCTVIFGRLSDLFSVRRLITIGIVTYAVGSLVGFVFQSNYAVILVGRALQGIGSAALPALVMVIVTRYFPPEVRGQLFGSVGSVISFAAGFGPVIGGFITGNFHWATLFLIPLLTLAALPFLWKILPQEPKRTGSIDLPGATLMTLGLGCLILWLTYPEWTWLTAGLVLMAGFVARILTAKEPFIDPVLFLNRPYRAGLFMTFLLSGSFMGVFFLLPLYLNRTLALDAQTIGLLLFPGAISGVFFGPFAGRMADKRGNTRVLGIGAVLLSSSLLLSPWVLALPAAWYPVWALSVVLVAVNIGIAFFNTGLVNGVSQTLPENETGVGLGLFNLVGFLAGAVGTALVAKILEAGLTDGASLLGWIGGLLAVCGTVYLVVLRSAKTAPRV